MKNILMALLMCALTVGASYAETAPADEEYRDLEELRHKLVRMKKEMDRFMGDIMATYPEKTQFSQEYFGQDVKVDVADGDKEITVKADLPGMDKDKIDITLENNRTLKIAGTREVFKKEEGPGVVRQERMHGRFERVLQLPDECVSEGIRAVYKNGVLEIVIPKKKKAKEESVKINVQ